MFNTQGGYNKNLVNIFINFTGKMGNATAVGNRN